MSELAADGIPVAVSLRVLKLSRQPYYRWRKQQVTKSELVEAYRANALFDATLMTLSSNFASSPTKPQAQAK